MAESATVNTIYYFIAPAITIVYYVAISDALIRKHKQNLKQYQPLIAPDISVFSLISNSFPLFMLTFIFSGWGTLLSKNPLIFIPLGLAAIGLLSYSIYKKYILTYFSDSKIVFWYPGVFKSAYMEAEIKNLEALIFAENDEVTKVMAKRGYSKFCFVNLDFDGRKKSVPLEMNKYDGQKLKAFFIRHNIPVYSKVLHEKTAKRMD